MATSLQKISSKIQRHIGDEGFQRIKRAELNDIIDDAIYAVGNLVRQWVETVKISPYAAVVDYTVADEADLPTLTPSVGETAYVTNTNERWQYYNLAWRLYPLHIAKIDPEVTRIYRSLQVRRNGITATEISFQALQEAYSTGYLFNRNNNETREVNGTQFAVLKRDDDGMDFHFTRDFSLGEEVVITYLREQPYTPTMWLDAITIPDAVAKAVEWQGIEACLERMFIQGDMTVGNRLSYARDRAKQETNKADAYLRNVIDENSTITTRPLRWLPEGD